jgi:hypothetical protein
MVSIENRKKFRPSRFSIDNTFVIHFETSDGLTTCLQIKVAFGHPDPLSIPYRNMMFANLSGFFSYMLINIALPQPTKSSVYMTKVGDPQISFAYRISANVRTLSLTAVGLYVHPNNEGGFWGRIRPQKLIPWALGSASGECTDYRGQI